MEITKVYKLFGNYLPDIPYGVRTSGRFRPKCSGGLQREIQVYVAYQRFDSGPRTLPVDWSEIRLKVTVADEGGDSGPEEAVLGYGFVTERAGGKGEEFSFVNPFGFSRLETTAENWIRGMCANNGCPGRSGCPLLK